MESKEVNVGKYVSRHLSQLKILARMLEHELESAKGGAEVAIDREVVESALDTLEIFVDDCENATGGARSRGGKSGEAKPVVARLN
ncbi:MAG: hypothetical protein KDE27_00235 [Planctomycetes bacterium]|nr:hypothetical protein [Planctomycetota bacterium]